MVVEVTAAAGEDLVVQEALADFALRGWVPGHS
jgi:hypothetical protein